MSASALSPTPSTAALERLRDATLSRTYVSLGARRTTTPHEFYRYPARFTPEFARQAIECFSRPGDLVLDPLVGGGTTVIEALASGRTVVASDLNPLAIFVTQAKSFVLTDRQVAEVTAWLEALPDTTNLQREVVALADWEWSDYATGVMTDRTWRITKLLRLAIEAIGNMSSPAERFCRCVLLRCGQWAFDMRTEVPTVGEVRDALIANGTSMLEVNRAWGDSLPRKSRPILLEQGLPGLSQRFSRLDAGPPAAIVTSPPYPGVYVNYHRWKLMGRREIRALYWIADRQDGHGLAHYTMGARADRTLDRYFETLGSAMSDLATLADERTTLVQMVGFSDPHDQFVRYLETMEAAGFDEVRLPALATAADGRLWRDVPNRRWWTEARANKGVAPNTSKEVVLVHRRG